MKGSLIIVGFFVLGIIVGVWDVIPASFPGERRELLSPLLPDVLRGYQHRLRYLYPGEFQKGESPTDDAAGDDHSGNLCRMRGCLPDTGTPSALRLSRHRFWLRILLIVEHLHHAVSGCRAGNHRPACQHLP